MNTIHKRNTVLNKHLQMISQVTPEENNNTSGQNAMTRKALKATAKR